MRILHIVQRYWPIRGGAEVHLGEISTRLAAEGHQITVATTDAQDFALFWDPSKRRLPEREIWQDDVRILRFPVRHLPISLLAYPGWRRLLWILSALRPVPVSLITRLARYTPRVPDLWHWLASTDEPFDLVAGMTICFEPLLEAGLRFARKRGIPFVIYPLTHLGAGERPGADALSRFYTMRHQVELVRQSDALIAQTPAERDFYRERGTSPERIHVVGPGCNPGDIAGGNAGHFRTRHSLEHPIVTMLGKMSLDKGSLHTIGAMKKLWGQGGKAHLVSAGDAMEPVRSYVQRLPEETRNRILLLGPVSKAEKRDLLAASDVLVMPSRTDSFGIVYLEAWLYGKPVVGARAWGVMDVIEDGKDGLLVSFGDVDALARAIKHILNHPEEAAAMGRYGREKALAQHTWDKKFPVIHEIYRRLVGASG